MSREDYLHKPTIRTNRYLYHVTPFDTRDAIDRLGILSRNDIGHGPRFGYPPAVFANNTSVEEYFIWWPIVDYYFDYLFSGIDPDQLLWEYDIWEIDTRIANTKWYEDPGTGSQNSSVFALDDIPREAIRLVRLEGAERRIRYSDGVASTYIWSGITTVLPRRPRYLLPCVR
ncbi:hypothetical protein [Rufibacter tibetensis]|uniref:DarT domain-containing protein n=1 Tax=Rufibacter tibetensis TaxID=512763 RepID=A0A0P0BZX5_9BACT|nr:hypothetical protein [Rufibacter tibetensis]ALI98081.1 hypothetical protein DC20_02690 [Rufibacter tibetensis]